MPKRDTVQLTIYNSEDLTLVRETRTVTFKKGVNPLQFSLGQYADRSDLGRAEVPDQPGEARRAGYDLSAR